MALVNRESIVITTLQTLAGIAPPGGVLLLSYKRNRRIALTRNKNGSIGVHEQGYVDKRWNLAPDDLEKHLKKLVKKEFPRSRKVRLVRFSDPAELGRELKKL